MKDEIKEIINQLEIVARKHTIEVCEDGSKIETMPASVVDELRLSSFSAELLLYYITNLQKENEELNRMCELYSKSLYYAELKDYKSRCEKAFDYIVEYSDRNYNDEVDLDVVLDILRGVNSE